MSVLGFVVLRYRVKKRDLAVFSVSYTMLSLSSFVMFCLLFSGTGPIAKAVQVSFWLCRFKGFSQDKRYIPRHNEMRGDIGLHSSFIFSIFRFWRVARCFMLCQLFAPLAETLDLRINHLKSTSL